MESDRALERRVDRARGLAEAPERELPDLVDDRSVPVRTEDVDERLGGDDLTERRRKRRRSDLAAYALDLIEHLVEPVAVTARPKLRVDHRDEPHGKLAMRGTNRHARKERADRHIPEVLVDQVGGTPDHVDIDAGVVADAGESLGERLGRDPVGGKGDRVDGAADQVDSRARRLQRDREAVSPGALAVQPDREAGKLSQLRDELTRAVRLQEPGRVVENDPRRADLRQAPRRLDERLPPAASVEQARVELTPGRDHRVGRDLQVPGVVQGIVEPEHVDSALGGARHEAADELVADRPWADEEPATDGEHERCRRPRLQRPDPLPRALDSAPHRRVERAAARDL